MVPWTGTRKVDDKTSTMEFEMFEKAVVVAMEKRSKSV
jgi:hypothetical protein